MSLTNREIQHAIYDRIMAAHGQCNSYYLAHFDGVLRGLVWALTGDDPGTELSRDMAHVCRLAGLPYSTRKDGDLDVSEPKPEATA